MKERELQKAVIELAHRFDWLVAHFPTSRSMRGDGAYVTAQQGDLGFPDLIMVRSRRLIAAELKSKTGQLRPGQDVWLNRLTLGGAETYVWRPRDWETGAIERVLRVDG